jgi:hypothetical protein
VFTGGCIETAVLLLLLVLVAARMCLTVRYLAMAVYADFSLPAVSCHVIMSSRFPIFFYHSYFV